MNSDDPGGRPGAPPHPGPGQLAALLSAGRGTLLDPETAVASAAAAVPGAAECGLTLVRAGSTVRTVAATGERAERVDALQRATGEGPSLDSAEAGAVCRVDDLSSDGRWPEFAVRCLGLTDVQSLLSVRLRLQGSDEATLTWFAVEPGAFHDDDLETVAHFATIAALALQRSLYAQEVSNLREALLSSRRIGTAIGILMQRDQLTSTRAFDRLVEASQNLNLKLRDIAAEVELTGELPEGDVGTSGDL